MFLDIVMGRKNQVGLALTPQAVAVIDELAEQTQLSRTEVVEAIAQARIQLIADGAEWAFRLQLGDEHTQVLALEPSTPVMPPAAPAPATEPVPADDAPEAEAAAARERAAADTIEHLQKEVKTLRSQLTEARSLRQELQIQLQEQAQTAPAAPTPVAVPAASTPAPVPANFLDAGVVKGLQEQLLNTRTAFAELEMQFKQQQVENDRLQQALVEAQQVASIGSSQLNRWQYKTFSR